MYIFIYCLLALVFMVLYSMTGKAEYITLPVSSAICYFLATICDLLSDINKELKKSNRE